ncbi:hypothetical protein HOA56_01220 [archaeon]|jgi:hypothetical protein|nr:hypothetical protein [archaeon]
MRVISLRLTKRQKEHLESLAICNGKSLSEFIRNSLPKPINSFEKIK